MTTLTFHLGRALGRRWGAGRRDRRHRARPPRQLDPWRALARERGVMIRAVAAFDPETGQLDEDDLRAAINARTRLVAIGAASNALGTINDVRRGRGLAHAAGALVVRRRRPLRPARARRRRGRSAATSSPARAYKFYGPHVGVLCGTPRPARRARRAASSSPRPTTAPGAAGDGHAESRGHRRRGGGGRLPGVARRRRRTGAPRLQAAFDALHARGQALVERLWSGLREIDGVTVYGPPPGRPERPTVSFSVGGVPSAEVARRAGRAGPSSSRTATSTPRPSSHGSATPRTASCAPDAPATRRGRGRRLLEGVRALAVAPPS